MEHLNLHRALSLYHRPEATSITATAQNPVIVSTVGDVTAAEVEICNDGLDNNHNGLIDKEDPSCVSLELSDLELIKTLEGNTSEKSRASLLGNEKA